VLVLGDHEYFGSEVILGQMGLIFLDIPTTCQTFQNLN
jgi:hypothetical protein